MNSNTPVSDSFEDNQDIVRDFTGKFAPATNEFLLDLMTTHSLITAGLLYQMMLEDANKVRVILNGPNDRLAEVNCVGAQVIVRPNGFRLLEEVGLKQPDGTYRPVVRDIRTPMLVRSLLVDVGGGFGIRFKYNGQRRCIVVC
jgi:hypothetical protein